jgi:hypothetical protein
MPDDSETLLPLTAHEKPIKSIFSDEYAFEIPVYQRPYAWELSQVQDLLSDIQQAEEDLGQQSYFLGSIVLVKKRTSAEASVIDGQQRLTTLTILIAVLRDLTTNADMFENRRRYVYQKGNPDEGTGDQYRLLTRAKDRAFFRSTSRTSAPRPSCRVRCSSRARSCASSRTPCICAKN